MVAPDSAPLARLVDASTPNAQRLLSGIRLLADGGDAWHTRLALIRRATHSLDLQTYQIEDDRSGRQLLHELHRAAERGVRVRRSNGSRTAATRPWCMASSRTPMACCRCR